VKLKSLIKSIFCVASILLPLHAVGIAAAEEYPRDGTVKIEKAKNLKDITQVLVPHFAISFVVADEKSAVASTEKNNPFARKAGSTTEATLVGLTPETMQTITDAAYKDLVASLEENGIKVIEHDAAVAQAKARETKFPMTKFLDGPREDFSLYHKYFNNDIKDLTLTPTGTQLMAPVIGNNPLPYGYGASARELGIPVLAVDYVLTFGNITAASNEYYGIAGRGNASAETSFSAGLQVMWSSDIKVTHSERKTGRLMIEKNAWTAEPFATMSTEKSGGLFGSSQSVTLSVDNAAYQTAALDVLSRATDNLVKKLAAQ